MPNIAAVLKDEIVRLARRELRAETEKLKRAASLHRSEIAALKRRVAALEQQLARLGKGAAAAAPPPTDGEAPIRFSAKGLHTHRQRLELSAAQLGQLLGVSGQTVYNWEGGSTRPSAAQIGRIAALRRLGKRAAQAELERANSGA